MSTLNLIISGIFHVIKNYIYRTKIVYIVENENLSIKHDGISITKNLNLKSKITTTHYGIRNSIVHYGYINIFFRESNRTLRLPHKSNKIIVTWFHIAPDVAFLDYIPEAIKYVDFWHTSCQLTKNEMITFGVPEEKIVVIPLGVSTKVFSPPLLEEKMYLREKFGIDNKKIVIGSYQKDGIGWEEGLTPKLIKGPDIFCDVVENLAKKIDIFVLLTGPARGYVKKRLEKAGIPYHYDFLDNPDELAPYYKVTDLYIVTSRAEGGPKQILESMASGVPVISTCVGMAPDVIIDGENGFIVEVEDVKALTQRALQILDNESMRRDMISMGLKTVEQYDWSIIAKQYQEKLYKEIS